MQSHQSLFCSHTNSREIERLLPSFWQHEQLLSRQFYSRRLNGIAPFGTKQTGQDRIIIVLSCQRRVTVT